MTVTLGKDLRNIKLDELLSSFAGRGYELTGVNGYPVSINTEETIIAALLRDKEPKARLLEGIPVLLLKNEVDYKFLRKLIDQYRLHNEFGYFGEFTLKYVENEDLSNLVEYCRSRLNPQTNISSLNDAFFPESSHEEERWKILGAPSYQALEEKVKLYSHD